MSTVIFACVHNAGRSQMAAAFLRLIANPARAKSNRDRKIFEQFTVLGLGW